MVNLQQILASNARISTSFPAGLVAVFVGSTSGIGEYAMKSFVKHAKSPRVFFVGRSQESADRIVGECKQLNSEGEYVFIKADVSILKNVDKVSKEIEAKVDHINLLFQTQGTLKFDAVSPDGLPLFYALGYASRHRFAQNLLPLIRKSPPDMPKRVISVLAGTKEGWVDTNDFPARKLSLLYLRGHMVSIITLSLENLAKDAPDVSFIHSFPGLVKSNIGRTHTGLQKFGAMLMKPIRYFRDIPEEESGERHVFLATSAKYGIPGVSLAEGVKAARDTKGKEGSGVYSVDWDVETSPKVETTLAKLRAEAVPDKLRQHTDEEFKRLTE